MNIALLTCDHLENYVSDEAPLATLIPEHCGWPATWVSWTSTIEWNSFSHAIIRTTWDYTHQRKSFLETLKQIEKQGVVLLNNYKTVEWNSHKSYLLDLQSQGVRTLETLKLNQCESEEVFARVSSWQQEQVILKPFVGAASHGLKIFPNTKTGLQALMSSAADLSQWFVQPFYEEIFAGEISLIYFNNQWSHGLKKIPKKGDFRSQEEFDSQIIPYQPSPIEIQYGEEILRKIKEPLLYARVDFLIHKGLPHLMELELIEPALYFRTHPQAFNHFTKALQKVLRTE